jgi:peroxiredoxin
MNMKPKTKVPSLSFPLVNDTQWNLEQQEPKTFTLIVAYRGKHCPVCKKQLEALQDQLDDFTDRGISVVAVSMDSEERAKSSYKEWDINDVPVGYGMKEETARELGLYISESISEKEPKKFSEPGLFLIKPDGTLYSSSIQTMPFARPQWDDLLKGVDFITKKDYPSRGAH